MFFACGIWCFADVSRVSPSSEQTEPPAGRTDIGWNSADILLYVCNFHCNEGE